MGMNPKAAAQQLRNLSRYIVTRTPSRTRVGAKLTNLLNAIEGRPIVAHSRDIPMGGWDGEAKFWPTVPGFEGMVERADKFGDAYEVWYQKTDEGFIVEFNGLDFVNSSGKRPGKWSADGIHGKSKDGTWKSIADIPKILAEVSNFAREAEKEAEEALLKLGGPKWELYYHYDDLVANFKNPDKYSDASMFVTFPNVMNVMAEHPGYSTDDAEVQYAAGSDYEGFFGKQRVERPFKSTKDIERILDEAEKQLWPRWVAR